MKKIRLFLLKAEYWVNCRIGPVMVNERKFPRFLHDMQKMQNKIEKLQSEVDSETNR